MGAGNDDSSVYNDLHLRENNQPENIQSWSKARLKIFKGDYSVFGDGTTSEEEIIQID